MPYCTDALSSTPMLDDDATASGETDRPLDHVSGSEGAHTDFGPGQVLDGRYRLDAVLGRGAYGEVYRATQLAVGRPVAVKVLLDERAQDARSVTRFEREARALAALNHPHVVQLVDFGKWHGGFYLVMELLTGQSLGEIIARDGPFPLVRARDITLQLLGALDAAHSAGVVHRDLKPSNVVLCRFGGREDFVKLLDFGIAKVQHVSGQADLTQADSVVGTPRYLSPEQASSVMVTAQSDLYSLGVLVYEMLTGAPLFGVDSVHDVVAAHLVHMPSPPTVNGEKLAGPLVDATMQCLAKPAWQRPGSAQAMIEMIRPANTSASPLEQSVATPPDPTMTLDARPVNSESERVSRSPSPWPWVVASVLVLTLVIALSEFVEVSSSGSGPQSAIEPAGEVAAPLMDVAAHDQRAPIVAPALKQAQMTSKTDVMLTTTIEVTSDPPAALVFIDGVFIGKAPQRVPRPVKGVSTEVEARMAGYASRSQKLADTSPKTVALVLSKRESHTTAEPGRKPTPTTPHKSRKKPRRKGPVLVE